MPYHMGIYGHNILGGGNVEGTRRIPPGKGHVNLQGAVFSANTNVHPAFGYDYKIKRNRAVVSSVINQTWGYHAQKHDVWVFGDVQNKLSDPRHRDPNYLLRRAREEGSIAGRSRAYIRPAPKEVVVWKNGYWLVQRTRGLRPTSLGPYGTVSSKQQPQSMLSRISGILGGSNQGVQGGGQ